MRSQAVALSDDDKKAVAEFISGKQFGAGDKRKPPACEGKAAAFDFDRSPAFSGWGISPANARYVPAAVSGITAGNISQLKLAWVLGAPNAVRMRSNPSFAGGAIYVGTDDGTVYALDAESGCERWEFQAPVEVRTSIVISSWSAGDKTAVPLAYFGDIAGNVYAVDAITGKLVWSAHADEHPAATLTGSPVLYRNRLYVPVASLEEGILDASYECCTFRGSIVAYDGQSGKRLWQTYMMKKPVLQGVNTVGAKQYGPSGAGIWNTPAIDEKRGLLYFGTGNNYSEPTNAISDSLVALNIDTGKIAWSYQALTHDAWTAPCVIGDPANCPKEKGPDADIGASVVLADLTNGGQLIVAAQKSGWVLAFNPDTHKLAWKTRVGRGGIAGGIYFGMAAKGDALYVPVHDQPDFQPHDIPGRPGLYALDLNTGRHLWKAPITENSCAGRPPGCFAGLEAAVTATDDFIFAGGNDGLLRAYDTTTGKIVWRYDTNQSVQTTSGAKAAGGSMGGATAPVPYDGMLVVVSGYGYSAHMPGNVMLVFRAK